LVFGKQSFPETDWFSSFLQKKFLGFLGDLLPKYPPRLFCVEEKLFDHCRVKYASVCPNIELRPLVGRISTRMKELGLRVWIKALHKKLMFVCAEENWCSDILVFFGRRMGRSGYLG